MENNTFLLSAIIFLPMLGALLCGVIKSDKPYFYHWLAAGFTGATFVLTLILGGRYTANGLAQPGF